MAAPPAGAESQARPAEPRRAIEVHPDDPSLGPADAPVTVVQFADFECPFCRRMSETLRQLRQRYGTRLRIVWKDYPLTRIHPRAVQAAQAARCANEQGRFWDYHDRVFVMGTLDLPTLKQAAVDVALDVPRFVACVDSAKYAALVERGLNQAVSLGLTSTPTTFVNGRMITGAQPYDVFARLVEQELGAGAR